VEKKNGVHPGSGETLRGPPKSCVNTAERSARSRYAVVEKKLNGESSESKRLTERINERYIFV